MPPRLNIIPDQGHFSSSKMDDQPFDDRQFDYAPLPPPNYETHMCYYPARPHRLRERFEAFLANIPDPEERDVEEMVRRLLVIVDHGRDEPPPPEEIPPPPTRPPPPEIRPPWVAPPQEITLDDMRTWPRLTAAAGTGVGPRPRRRRQSPRNPQDPPAGPPVKALPASYRRQYSSPPGNPQ